MVTCVFDASQFKVTIVFGVPISLEICTLSNIPFVFGQFGFYFALLYIFYVEYIFVIRGWFQSTKNSERGSLVLYCLIFQTFVTAS
jgi:hypothetical protein